MFSAIQPSGKCSYVLRLVSQLLGVVVGENHREMFAVLAPDILFADRSLPAAFGSWMACGKAPEFAGQGACGREI